MVAFRWGKNNDKRNSPDLSHQKAKRLPKDHRLHREIQGCGGCTMNIELAKEFYDRETTNRSEIFSLVSIVLGILTLLIGGASICIMGIENIKDFGHLTLCNKVTWFFLFLSLSVILIIMSSYNLFRSVSGSDYWLTKIPDYYVDFYNSYLQYFLSQGLSTEEAAQSAESAQLEELRLHYIEASSSNYTINIAKRGRIRASFQMSLISGFLLLSTFIFYIQIEKKNPEIDIAKIDNVLLKGDTNELIQQKKTGSTTTSNTSQTSKPTSTPETSTSSENNGE